GFSGDVLLVNGVPSPYLQVQPTRYRFRLVNGSNARAYEVALANGDLITQVASDHGLLGAPVTLASVTLGASERAEVVVDFSKYAGASVVLRDRLSAADAPGLVRFDVASGGSSPAPLP